MNELLAVAQVQSASYKTEKMQLFIINSLKLRGLTHTKDRYGNIYCTKGEADLYPAMVCHIDTVHNINNNAEVHISGDNMFAIDRVTMERYGIGGDDKVGIFITLQMFDYYDNFKAAFFLDEEVGCVGSRQCDFSFFDDCSMVLECDRQGKNDFVNQISGTKLYSDEVSEIISPILQAYDRKETTGGMTDVLEIAGKNKVCVANMSCGYYDPHTENEYISISDVINTMDMCIEIFDATIHKRFEIDQRQVPYSYGGNYMQSYYEDFYDDLTYDNHHEPKTCPKCGTTSLYNDPYDGIDYCIECEYESSKAKNYDTLKTIR